MIDRHKAAIRRYALSKPVQLAIDAGLITSERTFFDYGCGYGDDIRLLNATGFQAAGWDPYFRPKALRVEADVVNLGFVANVIENRAERVLALRGAWDLCASVLLVAVRSFSDVKGDCGRSYSDGCVTGRGTFQKFFDQTELKNWVGGTLGVEPVPLAPGVVVLFRDDQNRQDFVADRFRRSFRISSERRANALYEAHRELLDSFLETFALRGRLPHEDEWERMAELGESVGTGRQALGVLRRVLGSEILENIRIRRAEDLAVFLALEKFGTRPRFRQLATSLQRDVRSLFRSYRAACQEGDQLLFSAGNGLAIGAACRDSLVGKLTPSALYVHSSALEDQEGILRVYEGCARVLVGDVEEANVIKLHRGIPAVSYLAYPDFDSVAHPQLASSVHVNLRALIAKFTDYRGRESPPVLHRKETLVSGDYPGYKKFASLTQREERLGLLDETADIGTLEAWERALTSHKVTIQGHRIHKI